VFCYKQIDEGNLRLNRFDRHRESSLSNDWHR